MSQWKNADFCVSCKEYLTDHQVCYSKGRCPKCGYKDLSAGTIVDTFEKGYKKVRIKPWYKFKSKIIWADE